MVNFYSDVMNFNSDVVNTPNLKTLAISASQDAFFYISTVGTVGTYSGAFASLDAGNALIEY